MKRLFVAAPIVAALITAGLALPACAQRGASRGGGFSAPSFRGGTSSAPHFTGAPRYTGSPAFATTPRLGSGLPYSPAMRSPYYGAGRYRQPRIGRYGIGVPYLGAAWIAPGYLGYPDTTPYDTPDENPDAAPAYDAAYDPGFNNPGFTPQPAAPVPYPAYSAPPPAATPDAAPEDAVTLVFKDGRPNQQIHNYVLTRTTLYVHDQHHRDIPLDQLDLDATQKINHDAGVDFALPQSSR